MANSVKWIKITTDIFDDEKFDAVKTLEDRHMVQLAWIKILCLAGRCNDNGFLTLAREIPYTDEMMASRFDMSVGDVQRSLEIFQRLGMIEIVDNVYMVSNWLKYQSGDRLEEMKESNRERQRRYREKQKQARLDKKSNVTRDVTNNVIRSYSYSNSLSYNDVNNINNTSSINDVSSSDDINNNTNNISNTSNNNINNTSSNISNTDEYNDKGKNIDNYKYMINNGVHKDSGYISANKKLHDGILDWMAYRDERKPTGKYRYLEQGMKKWLSEVVKRDKEYGTDAIVDIINRTIAAQYEGIGWFWLKDYEKKPDGGKADENEQKPKRRGRWS